ncbi:hypothetical protein LTR56_011108 [Elasticomyces elasticus]|nr:hypothetical protein LTR56_011108 [Elasticomyces elasticus]KAK3662471.1 hypothetical protein LTR22_006750 [Elasticomyces elasticus]KAK4926460.1 hypothetical protein LTR49_006667 [Elasticomyces elasticus]KAK5761166.1 hypothetical protein LTS12_008647 [Elasticomyces elasticus]
MPRTELRLTVPVRSAAPTSTRPNVKKLYEGNFSHWIVHDLQTVLQRSGITRKTYESLETLVVYLKSLHRHARDKVVGVIAEQVCATVLSRTAVSDRHSLVVFLQALRQASEPFRFLDLPKELRDRVYETHILDAYHGRAQHRLEGNGRLNSAPRPSIISTSSQVLDEFLPMFYMTTKFRFEIYLNRGSSVAGVPIGFTGVPRWIRRWARVTVKKNATHLRQVSVVGNGRAYFFTFSPGVGLRVRYPESLDQLRKTDWDQHVAQVEASRRLRELNGEAVLTALTSRPALWRQGA